MTIRFDDAWRNAGRVADDVARTGLDVVLVRDLAGRITLVLDDTGETASPAALADEFRGAAGGFASRGSLYTPPWGWTVHSR